MKKIKNILISGSNGQLGRCLRDALNGRDVASYVSKNNFIFTDIEELDITDIDTVARFVSNNKIDCIINAAAYTNVDNAEVEKNKVFFTNKEGVRSLVYTCCKQNVFLIHISTDYVFDGEATQPYKTNASKNPLSVYGVSKLAGEYEILYYKIPSIIIRTSWLYSKYGHNFLNTMLKLGNERDEIGVVDDQVGAPTNANDLATTILNILPQIDKISKPTIFHYANEGVTSWYGFAKEIMKIAQLNCKVNPITTDEFPSAAKRPKYSVLDLSKIKKHFNIQIPTWEGSLKREVLGL